MEDKKPRQALSRKQLANLYGVTTRTLSNWLQKLNLEIPKFQLITPKYLDQFFEKLGEP